MICIPVAAATQEEALQAIQKSAGLADVLELRMDLISGGKVKELVGAVRAASSSVKVLVTNRSDDPGRSSAEEERIGVLLDGVRSGADFVDVELATMPVWRERLRSLIAEHGDLTGLVVSHHDFRKTPSLKTLIGFLDKSVSAGARVVKIVTFARSPEDNLPVLSLIPYARRRNMDIIACCMGEHGRISRVMAPLLGSLFTFASLEQGAESASGQLTVREMRQIFRILAGKNPDC
jgi:3-dehydroquinate dehydratase type I